MSGPDPRLAEKPRASDHITAAIGGVLAAGLASAGMLLLRETLQVRSVPERLMEWLLLFVPPGAFEATLQRFSVDAKRYALAAAVVVSVGLLALVGYALLRRGTSLLAFAAIGFGLWLLVMLVIMPLTSAGVFAADLLQGQAAAVGGYLAVCLTFVATLAAFRLRRSARPPVATAESSPPLDAPHSESVSRRAALGLLGATGVAYVGTYGVSALLPGARDVATVVVVDPQSPLPSGGINSLQPHPSLVDAPDAAPTVASAPPTPAADSLPEPTTLRQLPRDKDGALMPSGRPAGELASLTTSNDTFYIVTKNAGGDPIIHPRDWRLLVDGEVQQPFQLDYATLRKLPSVEVTKTLECISNFVGKPELAPFGSEMISTAVWKGVRVSDVLQLVGGVKPGADWLAVLASDEYTSALPLEVALDPGTLLVYEMNGQTLPREHGYPARLLVPGLYGMKSAKWVVGLRPLRREFIDWYGQRNWSKTAEVRTMSRIDQPAPGAALSSGEQRIAGVAYAGLRGIQQVEFSPDGGQTWQVANLLEPPPGPDAWVRWEGTFQLGAGSRARLLARATDGTGELQVEAFSLPQPDGGSGWPSVEVQGA
jgi:DMSO/TMAO reductase YedYZ molybdopterin-dependent catalytic subunit